MNNSEYKNVYASYTVTPQSAVLLQQFSRDIMRIFQKYPMWNLPVVKTPSQFHITADYRWNVTNMDEYIASVQKRKKNGASFIEFDGVWIWKSKTNGNDIIYIKPTWEIPFENITDYDSIPHMTAAEILTPDNTFLMRLWLCSITNVFDAWRELWGEWPFVPIGIETSKIQIWWTRWNEKKIIVEI